MQNRRGFTIVELLIVIVVIAILAAVTVVAFSGIQVRANDTATLSSAAGWEKWFRAYKAENGTYPVPSPTIGTKQYCFGKLPASDDWDEGECTKSGSTINNASVLNGLVPGDGVATSSAIYKEVQYDSSASERFRGFIFAINSSGATLYYHLTSAKCKAGDTVGYEQNIPSGIRGASGEGTEGRAKMCKRLLL